MTSFNEALVGYLSLQRAWEISVVLHNLAAVQVMVKDDEAAERTLNTLEELRGQFDDEFGMFLTSANLGYQFDQPFLLEEAVVYFESYDLPQEAVVNNWLDLLDP
jgi:hypothetical protein